MAQTGSYCDELEAELKHCDPSSHASRLITQEIERLTKGEDDKKDRPVVTIATLDLHSERPQKCAVKIRIPVKEHPRYNFVGKLLGPKGSTLKALQDQSGCKMAIMGKGSMREKTKEEELRKEGGKYAHLSEDLHILVECFADVPDGYHRLGAALTELRKFVIPELADDMYGGGDMGMRGEMGMNGGGAPRGRGGAFRGGPPERGGRGGFRGRGNGPAPPGPPARGAPAARGGGPPPRGAPRGGAAPPGRGGPAARGAPPTRGRPAAPAAYDGYGAQESYGGSGGYEGGYEESYGQEGSYYDSYGQASSGGGQRQDSSYYDYGTGSGAGSGYDSYSERSGGYGGGDSWGASGKTAPPARGGSRGARSHPYARQGAGGGY